ncbi:MAG: flippase-like domain-containing protein [Actinomycetota bacterium]|nr:flippase-like domain-containing protein [Actinomycetota bacterium]
MLAENPGRLARALAVFGFSLALGFAGLYLVAGDQIFRVETYRVRDPSSLIIALCVVAFIVEWFVMDPARIWLLCRNQKIRLPFRSAVPVHLTSMFVASITPGNAAVGPTTAVALRHLGVPFGKSVGVAIQVLVLDMIYFAWTVPLSLGYLIYSDTLRLPPGPEFAALAIAALAMIGAVFLTRYPRPVVRLILAIARWQLMARFASRLRKVARDYYRSARAFKSMALSTWLALNLVVAAGWFSGYVLFWLLLKLYGVDVGLPATLAILNSITLVAHVFPTPGGSGFMEAALGLSVGANAPNVAAALLIWRLASYHAIFLLGPPAAWLLYLSKPVTGSSRGRKKDPR